MAILIWSIAVLLAGDLLLIAALLINHLNLGDPTASLLELGPLVIAAGVLVAVLTFGMTQRRNRSEDLLEAATDLLERAYNILSSDGKVEIPPNDRRTWLSAARLLRTSERLGEKINDSSHQMIYQAKREYWRSKFYDLIFPSVEGLPRTYYAEHPEDMIGYVGDVRAPVSEKSLAVLHRFISWPKKMPDPIGDEKPFTKEEIGKMEILGPRELGKLLTRVRELEAREMEKVKPNQP